jgi:hypothetical protein
LLGPGLKELLLIDALDIKAETTPLSDQERKYMSEANDTLVKL